MSWDKGDRVTPWDLDRTVRTLRQWGICLLALSVTLGVLSVVITVTGALSADWWLVASVGGAVTLGLGVGLTFQSFWLNSDVGFKDEGLILFVFAWFCALGIGGVGWIILAYIRDLYLQQA